MWSGLWRVGGAVVQWYKGYEGDRAARTSGRPALDTPKSRSLERVASFELTYRPQYLGLDPPN